ncbi:MAG: fused MFS/spermidine synthase, partial [Burkholderiaceae bacterium]|nr:fused MFS/spermidine synthase [Burkholderiaceae bacterium]
LMMSLGGALGGLAVGLVAVKVFNANYEFGLGLALTLIIAAVMVRSLRLAIPVVLIVAGGFGGYYAYANRDYFATQQTLLMKRNFYGALSVRDYYRDDPQHAVRRFVHGVIMHGEQFQAPERLDEATAYFRQGSGIGRTMTALNQPNRRIGIIGLGAGTLATYGRKGDTIRFYEINPDVIEVAHSHFSFLSRSRANIELVLGDARLAMEREAPQAYDLIVIDAFSGDSIPVHLATDEALAVYLRHLKPGGVIAFHISNKFLRLAPVLQRLADHRGLDGMSVSEPANLRDHYSSDWFLMTTDPRLRNHPAIASQIEAVEEIPGLGLWTDDFNNLFQILK